MPTTDIVILIVIAIPAIAGAFYGFLNIIFSLLAWSLALGAAVKLVPYFTPMLENYVETPLLRVVLAFAGLFLVGLMILSGLGFFIVKLLGRTGLTATDRILGLFFGMGLGGLIITIIVFLAGFTAYPGENWWQESKLVVPFQQISIWAQVFLPENIAEYHDYKFQTGPEV
jgi:membrane protein required for colicin V production